MADQRGGVMGGAGSGWHGPRDPAFPARDRDIVELWKGHMTLREIGDEYGISWERVRQILNRDAPGIIDAVKQEKERLGAVKRHMRSLWQYVLRPDLFGSGISECVLLIASVIWN